MDVNAIDRDPLEPDEYRADHLLRDLHDYDLAHLDEMLIHRVQVNLHDDVLNLDPMVVLMVDLLMDDRNLVAKFRDELRWQEYARHLYARLGDATRRSLRFSVLEHGDARDDRARLGFAEVDLEVEQLVARSVAHFGRVDGLVNNAAGNFISPTERLSGKAFEGLFAALAERGLIPRFDNGEAMVTGLPWPWARPARTP